MRPVLIIGAAALAATLAGLAAWLFRVPEVPARDFAEIEGDAERGAYVARLAGCIACHTDTVAGGNFLAGGAPIKTPFGTFRAPNITPHPEDGIGGWSLEDFSAALTHGVSPNGTPYYPVFPYPAYATMTDRDIVDLWAAFQTVPPVAGTALNHEVDFPFNLRLALRPWQNLFKRGLDPTWPCWDHSRTRIKSMK